MSRRFELRRAESSETELRAGAAGARFTSLGRRLVKLFTRAGWEPAGGLDSAEK